MVAVSAITAVVITLFGSTAYDAAFNARATDISDRTNRVLFLTLTTLVPLIIIFSWNV